MADWTRFLPDGPTRIRLLLAGRKYAGDNGLGVAGSLALHGLALLLILLFAVRSTTQHPPPPLHIVPIDVIRLGEETASPIDQRHALVPQRRAAAPHPETAPTRETVSPRGTKPAPNDALDAKLKALARLRQPPTDLRIADEQGVSNVTASNGVPGDSATYSVRDYVRAQVLRRWTFNFTKVSGHTFVIPLRVVMKRDGTIVTAEIVEQKRAKTDVLYRDVALSARNAALLASPIPLPPGDYPKEMHFTLSLDPRDTLR